MEGLRTKQGKAESPLSNTEQWDDFIAGLEQIEQQSPFRYRYLCQKSVQSGGNKPLQQQNGVTRNAHVQVENIASVPVLMASSPTHIPGVIAPKIEPKQDKTSQGFDQTTLDREEPLRQDSIGDEWVPREQQIHDQNGHQAQHQSKTWFLIFGFPTILPHRLHMEIQKRGFLFVLFLSLELASECTNCENREYRMRDYKWREFLLF